MSTQKIGARQYSSSAGGGGGVLTISAGGSSNSVSQLVFSNSNGLAFGLNGSTITGSYSQNPQSSYVFSNSNGITWGTNGSTITGSVQTNYLTTAMQSNAATISNVNLSAGTTSQNLSAFVFSNSNNLSFGLNGSTVTGSASFPAQTSLSYSNLNGISFGIAGSTLTASVQLTSQSNQAFSASGGSSAFQTLVFSNGSGITFSNSNGSVMATVQTNYLTTAMQSNAATISNIRVSAGGSSSNVSAITFSNGNGVSFGYDGANITASVAAAGGAQTGISGIAAGGVTATSGTVQWSNLNGVTFGMNGQTMTASVQTNYLTTAALSGDTSKYFQNWKLTGNTAGTTSSAQGTDFWLAGGNGVTISGSSNTLSLSVATNYQSQGAYLTTARGSTDGIGLNTAQTNVTWTVNSSGLSFNAGGYAGTASSFGGTNISGSMTHNSAGLTLSMSVAAPGGGAAINVSAGTTSNNLQTLVFSNSNNVSFGLNGSTVSASVQPPGTFSSWQMTGGFISSGFQYGNSVLQISGQNIPGYVTGTQMNAWVFGSTKSTTNNTTYGLSLGISMGIYTRSQSSLILATSASFSTNLTNSSNANTVAYGSMRQVSGTANINITPGDYWFAFLSSTASANQNSITMSNFGLVNGAAFYQDVFGGAPNATKQIFPGMGSYSVVTGALPATIQISEIKAGGGNGFFSAPWMAILNYTA